ncbi:MAG: FeoA family protein [Verrucomicrobiia bacterium]
MLSTLADLPIGTEGRVARLDGAPADARRLVEMGLTSGARIRVVRQAPLGDPIEVSVRGCRFSIRRADACAVILLPPDHV